MTVVGSQSLKAIYCVSSVNEIENWSNENEIVSRPNEICKTCNAISVIFYYKTMEQLIEW